MDIVENPVYEVFMDHVDQILDRGSFFSSMTPDNREKLKRGLRAAYTRHDYDLVVSLPGAKSDFPLTPRQQRALKNFGMKPEDVIVLLMNGTTASGHCCTTIGNTLRMIAYALFDAFTAGILEPWSNDQNMIRVMCAGDDCIRFVRPDLVQNLSAVVRGHAASGSRELDNG